MRFWTSDLHFGHANIIKYCDRPYDDTDIMDPSLINLWNSVVHQEDEVMVLGDVALGNTEKSLQNVLFMNGKKFLVPGNHDKCWSGHKNYTKHFKMYEDVGFNILPEQLLIHIDKFDVNVSHFPYKSADERFDKDRFNNPLDDGLILIHGHVHDLWRVNGRQINVGVDAWNYTPVAEDVLVDIMRNLSTN